MSFAQVNKSSITKQTNQYFKKISNGVYDKYKPIKTQIKDTVLLGDIMYKDSLTLSSLSNAYDTISELKTLKLVHVQTILRSPIINKYILDNNLYNMFLDTNFKFKNLLDTLVKKQKTMNKNSKIYNIVHTFNYENNVKKIETDTAILIYVPKEFTLYSSFTTYKKGINLIVVASDFKKRIKSEMMREKLLKKDEEETRPKSKQTR
jgi:hypothetical protein